METCKSQEASDLVLSLFPGIGLLDMAFEQAGFCVVRGPDLLWGGDIRRFEPPPGRFEGVIGGSPCQDFSKARRAAPTGVGYEMIWEFRRVVLAAKPTWWLLENVPTVPDLPIPGYSWQRLDLNATQFGSPQRRIRHFQFGDIAGRYLVIDRPAVKVGGDWEATVTSKTPFEVACVLQGIPAGYDLPGFTRNQAARAVANGVPLPLGLAVAEAIRDIGVNNIAQICGCGCGRPVRGKQTYALPACRKREERRRKSGKLV